jgi:hypothetical protein
MATELDDRISYLTSIITCLKPSSLMIHCRLTRQNMASDLASRLPQSTTWAVISGGKRAGSGMLFDWGQSDWLAKLMRCCLERIQEKECHKVRGGRWLKETPSLHGVSLVRTLSTKCPFLHYQISISPSTSLDGSRASRSCANHLFAPIIPQHHYFFSTNKLFAPVIW